jgi:hypothetical protein
VRHEDFLRALGIMTSVTSGGIAIAADDDVAAEAFFTQHGLDPKTTVALYAGGQGPEKDCAEYGGALADICVRRSLSVVLLGAETNRAVSEINAQALRAKGVSVIDAVAAVTLGVACAIVKRCALAVGADTALTHVAVCYGVPNVTVLPGWHFGRFLPYDKSSSVVCAPLSCYGCDGKCRYRQKYCVTEVRAATIARACRDALGKSSEKPRVYAQGPESTEYIKNGLTRARPDRFLDMRSVEYVPVGGDISAQVTSARDTSARMLQCCLERLQAMPEDRSAYTEAALALLLAGQSKAASRLMRGYAAAHRDDTTAAAFDVMLAAHADGAG